MTPMPRPVRSVRAAPVALLPAVVALVLLAGCTPHDDPVPPPAAGPVTAYGLTLDEHATPQQVAFVLLRALADDVQAAQAHRHDDQRSALALAWSLAAYDVIEQRLIESHNRTRPTAPVSSLGADRDRRIWQVVHFWAPIVAHYVPGFDVDFQTAADRMLVALSQDRRSAHVFYPTMRDPSQAEPAAQERAVVDVELHMHKAGDKEYWRVARVAFTGPRQLLAHTRPATAPAVPASGPG